MRRVRKKRRGLPPLISSNDQPKPPKKRKKRKVRDTGAKGKTAEARFRDLIEAEGYLVHQAHASGGWRHGRYYTKSNDLFGAFDFICVKQGNPIRFVQVTHTGGIGERRRKIIDLCEGFFPVEEFCTIEVWGWVGGRKKIDRRFKSQKRFIRRNYWRRFELTPTFDWDETTDDDAGWEDHGGRNPDKSSRSTGRRRSLQKVEDPTRRVLPSKPDPVHGRVRRQVRRKVAR